MLGPEATARILDGGKALLTWLWQTGRLPDGELFAELWLDADAKTVAVRCGSRIESLDYQETQTLLRELARNARREAVARKPDPPGLDVESRWEYLYHQDNVGSGLGRGGGQRPVGDAGPSAEGRRQGQDADDHGPTTTGANKTGVAAKG